MADHYCFLFRQAVERFERESENIPAVHEEYVRTGLLLLDSDAGSTTWSRALTEILSNDAELAEWRQRTEIPLAEMKKLHGERWSHFRLPFGLKEETEVLSGPLNQ